MKIKKLIESKIIVEADEEAPATEITEIDPQTDPVPEIADAIQADVKETTDGEKEMSDKEATDLAVQAKKDAKEVNAGKISFIPSEDDYNLIKIKNRLVDILDDALETARYNMGEGIKAGANVLIEGLPGAGKTAIVESWCKTRGLVPVAVNATDPRLETAVNGMYLRDERPDAEPNKLATVRSNVLDKLLDPQNKGKCVLFVDEFNRQQDAQLRRVFLSLFNEKRNADGTLDFSETLLFTIVCINPAGKQYHDAGTVQLNQAERTRFAYDITDFDSTPEEALEFFKGNLQKRLLKLGVIVPGSEIAKKYNLSGPYKELSEEDLKKIDIELKIYDLARFLLDTTAYHPFIEFTFDGRADLADINDLNKQLFNSRKLTDLLYVAKGDKDKFLHNVDTTSNLLGAESPRNTKKMLHDILDSYTLDLKGLRQEFGVEEAPIEEVPEEIKADIEAEANTKEDELPAEDDMELFNQPTNASSGTTAIDSADLVSDISNVYTGW